MEALWLGEPKSGDPRQVGGKASSLSRLASRYRVPPGFCLPKDVFDHALGNGFRIPDDPQDQPRLPPSVYETVSAAYLALASRCDRTEPSVAVRSSALDEDGEASSFAGQYATFLNVVGVDRVAASVLRCWASGATARVQEYRRFQGMGPDAKLAVLVQEFIPSDISMVVFSANPVSGESDELLINANWGLGETVVGGTVTPDTYVVRKPNLAILERRIAEKLRMAVPTDGGTAEVETPRILRTMPALTDAQVLEVARLGIDLESTMGWPVDVECTYQADQLFLLQCRPITTLRKNREAKGDANA